MGCAILACFYYTPSSGGSPEEQVTGNSAPDSAHLRYETPAKATASHLLKAVNREEAIRAGVAICLCLGLLAASLGLAEPTPAPAPDQGQAVLTYLERMIAWYRHVNAIDPEPDISGSDLLRLSIRQTSAKALQLAFDFARADAALLSAKRQTPSAPVQAGDSATPSSNLTQASANANARVNGLQTQLDQVNAALQTAPARSRATLVAQRDTLQAQLGLAKEVQATVQNLVGFQGSLGGTNGITGGLLGQINELQRSVPETSRNTQPTPTPTTATAAPDSHVFHPEAAGIVGLTAQLFAVARARNQLEDLNRETTDLLQTVDQMRAPLIGDVRSAISRSEALASNASSASADQLAAAQHEISTLAARFKQVSPALLPIGESAIAMQATRGTLLDWRNTLGAQYSAIGRALFFRAGLLAIAICILLIFSEIWRRATFRYVRDARRQRQFLMLRRVMVSFAIVLILTFGFLSEIGSLATYAGFLTAGIAVALQNVILSVVAYFFLIGRYGVRTGDRVTISGVTGNVVDVGLVRIYLMELAGSGADLHPTGRVVVFSNSVLFQPAALFKQLPGADYAWHTVTLTLSADSDFQTAEKTLTAAVDSVYQEYRRTLEQQSATFGRSVGMTVAVPRPEVRLQYGSGGLDVTVRYPVEVQNAANTDNRIMKALYDAIEHEPKVKLASAGTPKLEAV